MKSLLLAFSVLVVARHIAAADSINVMTWNIRYDNPGDGENAWKHRKDWLAEIIVREKTEIAGFQEVLTGQFEDLKKRLPDMDSYGVGRDDGHKRGEFVPIFFRKSRFELIDKGTFWLSPTSQKVGSKGWDAAITRITSWVKLKDRDTATVVYVLNAHFDHKGKEARQKSSELINDQVRKQFADHPVIFVGDLNTTPSSPPYATLVGNGSNGISLFRDAYEHSAKNPEGPDSTWNGINKIVAGNRIDFVCVTQALNVLSLRTLVDQREGRFPSDHLPVLVEMAFKSN